MPSGSRESSRVPPTQAANPEQHGRNPLRPIRLAVVLVAATVTLVSCGAPGIPGVASVGGPRPSSSPRLTAEQARLAWARCMRQHGVDQPDPGQQGSSQRPITNKAAYTAAQQACAYIIRDAGLESGTAPSAAQQDRMLRYARCMRSHGIDVSDPHMDNGQLTIDIPKSSINSPQYDRADQACRQLLRSGSGGSGS